MRLTRTWIVALAAVCAAAFLAAGAAIAASHGEAGARTDAARAAGQACGPGQHGMGHRALLDAAATYLGITRAELHQAERDGKSLATLARENGKSVDGLKEALLAAATRDLGESVDAAELAERIDRLVERAGFGRRGFRGRPGAAFMDA